MASVLKNEASPHQFSQNSHLRQNDGLELGVMKASALATKLSPTRALQLDEQIRILRHLKHVSQCNKKEGEIVSCPQNYKLCGEFSALFAHILQCSETECTFQNCREAQRLMQHHGTCRHAYCPLCIPVKHDFCRNLPCPVCVPLFQVIKRAREERQKAFIKLRPPPPVLIEDSPEDTKPDDLQPPAKKVRKHFEMELERETGRGLAPSPTGDRTFHPVKDTLTVESFEQLQVAEPPSSQGITQSLESRLMMALGTGAGTTSVTLPDQKRKTKPKLKPKLKPSLQGVDVKEESKAAVEADRKSLPASSVKPSMNRKVTILEDKGLLGKGGAGRGATPLKGGVRSLREGDKYKVSTALGHGQLQSKGVGTSMAELFTAEMIEQHLQSLRSCVPSQVVHETGAPCKLCGVEKLYFDPPPIYCTYCGKRVQRQKVYYTAGTGEQKIFFCGKCHGEVKSDPIRIDGYPAYPKNKLEKRINNEETEEPWVECETCEKWVHQVCALFNARRNEGNAVFTCAVCLADQLNSGLRQPLPSTAVLGAKDLPRNVLSDELEERLAKKLGEERKSRATSEGRHVFEVPAAEELVVRVVSSVNKVLETKPLFLQSFEDKETGALTYPKEFPFKSKVVLLFQRIEGVEVCLYGMYVQEFGAECQQPNSRRVYLSYLDSVKYFRPDVRTQSREALRTFVYHEILIGYLEHCKKRGFTSCYIWACPPLKGEDYILYCHPEIQKTPQPAKLREWYLSMLRKAQEEGIVVEVCNLYETFFVKCGESRAQAKAARLPYFEGDYWPGAMEEVVRTMKEERVEEVRRGGKKGKKPGKRGGSRMEEDVNAPTDEVIMAKLGDSILSMKEDFIMVHMYHCCTHCKEFILGDRRWTCSACPSFNLCTKCYEAEKNRSSKDRHPINAKEAHSLLCRPLKPAPMSTEDKDETMESEFFDTRQAFLSLCQGNHYQYDTLRRAKHSSLMMLYHLHNPTAPAFASSCNVCQADVEAGQGWRCEQCDYDVCNECFGTKPPGHPHPLLSQAGQGDPSAQNQEGRNMRIHKKRKIQDLLRHAALCRSGAACDVPKCQSMHRLFRHGQHCLIRVNKGCAICKRMWQLLRFHAKNCKENSCNVPRCTDLRKHMQRMVQQSEARRMAAVKEMMRQRKSESRARKGF